MKRDDKIYKGFLYKALLDYQFRFQSTLDAYKRLMKTANPDEASIYKGCCKELEEVLADINDVLNYLDSRYSKLNWLEIITWFLYLVRMAAR